MLKLFFKLFLTLLFAIDFLSDTGPSEVKRSDADYEMGEAEDHVEVDVEEKDEEHVEEEGHDEESIKGTWIRIPTKTVFAACALAIKSKLFR